MPIHVHLLAACVVEDVEVVPMCVIGATMIRHWNYSKSMPLYIVYYCTLLKIKIHFII